MATNTGYLVTELNLILFESFTFAYNSYIHASAPASPIDTTWLQYSNMYLVNTYAHFLNSNINNNNASYAAGFALSFTNTNSTPSAVIAPAIPSPLAG
jgi:hypothetical protein